MQTSRISGRRIKRAAIVAGVVVLFGVWTRAVLAAEAKAAVPAPAMTEAKEIFTTRCSVCHGPQGKGDGPGSASLNPKPRNLTEDAWQKTVADDYIEKIVQFGGTAVGKSAMMPGNPDLIAKPDVVKGLRAIVRGLDKK